MKWWCSIKQKFATSKDWWLLIDTFRTTTPNCGWNYYGTIPPQTNELLPACPVCMCDGGLQTSNINDKCKWQ